MLMIITHRSLEIHPTSANLCKYKRILLEEIINSKTQVDPSAIQV